MTKLSEKAAVCGKLAFGFQMIRILLIVGILMNQKYFFYNVYNSAALIEPIETFSPITSLFFVVPALALVGTVTFLLCNKNLKKGYVLVPVLLIIYMFLTEIIGHVVSYLGIRFIANNDITVVAAYTMISNVVRVVPAIVAYVSNALLFVGCGLMVAKKYAAME